MPNLAILTNGGDTCALNASVEAIRSEMRPYGYRIIGIRGGYHGLLYENFIPLDSRMDETRGGSILRSLRESPVKYENNKYVIDGEKVNKMVETLKKLEIDVLVVIGGDGTLQATKMFHEVVHNRSKFEFKIMGFPKTIDNDIRTKTMFEGTEVALCPGYPSAARKIFETAADIRTTATSAQRVFGIETMGRDAGWLAAAAAGGVPDMILIPEVTLDKAIQQRVLQRTKELFEKYLQVVIVVSEGTWWINRKGERVQMSNTNFGPRKLGGAVDRVVKFIERNLSKHFDAATPFGVRPHHTDYTPRAGAPCYYDLKLVRVLAQRLARLIERRQFGMVPMLKEVVHYDELSKSHTRGIEISMMGHKPFPDADFYDREKLLPNEMFYKFLRTITSGPDSTLANDTSQAETSTQRS